MPDGAYVIRYPDGDYEYVVSPAPAPSLGAVIERKQAAWKVTEIVENTPATVYVAAVPDPEHATRP